MSEELIMNYNLYRDFVEGGKTNEPVLVKVSIFPHDRFVRQYPSTNCDVILAVDTSGSMDDPFSTGAGISRRLAVLDAALKVVSQLKPDDTLSLVCFDSTAVVDIDHNPARNDRQLNLQLGAIKQHNGGTNFQKAFEAISIVAGNNKNPTTRVVFLTDGNSNQGDDSKALEICKKLGETGVVIDCLGVGEDFNFKLMQSFTALSNGMTMLVKTPGSVHTEFLKLVENAQQSLVKNAVFRFQSDIDLRDVEVAQVEPEVRFLGSPDRTPNINFRHNLASLSQNLGYSFIISLKLDIPSADVKPNIGFMDVRLDYDVPVRKLTGQKIEAKVCLNIRKDSKNAKLDTDIAVIYAKSQLEKMTKELDDFFRTKEWKKCGIHLKKMIDIADHNRLASESNEFRRRLDTLERNGQLTQDDLNNITYSTSKTLTGGQLTRDPSDM